MDDTTTLLTIIVLLLAVIGWNVHKIAKRTREHFPTEKERDKDWLKRDPVGHYEAQKSNLERKS